MNSREKFLAIILATVVILLGGFKLLIEPEIKNLGKAMTNLSDAVSKKKAADLNVARSKTIDNDNKLLEGQIIENTKAYFPTLKSDEINIFFQGLADKSGILFNSITMTTPIATQITNPTNPKSGITYPALDAANSIESITNGTYTPQTSSDSKSSTSTSKSTANATQEKQVSNDTLEMMTVSIQFNGTYDQIIGFINEVKNCGKITRITTFSITKSDTGQLLASISAECYGVKKFLDDGSAVTSSLPAPSGKAQPFA